jgi:hypothetical protein
MMSSDGSGKTEHARGMWGNPSLGLYNNHRWFISKYIITGEFYADGITQRTEVFALRDDFHPTRNNNALTRVQLTDDPTLQPDYSEWIPGGAQISFRGRRWSSLEPGATILEGGIYTASLMFDTNGNIVGVSEQPAAPTIPFALVETTYDGLWTALNPYFCWARSGDFVAYANATRNELWIADLLNNHRRIYVIFGTCDQPQWSPDGSTIAFRSGYGITTVNPDGTGIQVIVPHTSTWVYSGPHFSPTGSYIIYDGCHQTGGQFDVFRATVKGAKRVNLTNTTAPGVNEYTTFGAVWR